MEILALNITIIEIKIPSMDGLYITMVRGSNQQTWIYNRKYSMWTWEWKWPEENKPVEL